MPKTNDEFRKLYGQHPLWKVGVSDAALELIAILSAESISGFEGADVIAFAPILTTALNRANSTRIAELEAALRGLLPLCLKNGCRNIAQWVNSMSGARLCDDHKTDTCYIVEEIAAARAALAEKE